MVPARALCPARGPWGSRASRRGRRGGRGCSPGSPRCSPPSPCLYTTSLLELERIKFYNFGEGTCQGFLLFALGVGNPISHLLTAFNKDKALVGAFSVIVKNSRRFIYSSNYYGVHYECSCSQMVGMSVVGFLVINNTDIGELKFPLPPSIKLEPEETPHPFQYMSSATDAGTFCRFHFSILTQILNSRQLWVESRHQIIVRIETVAVAVGVRGFKLHNVLISI